MLRFFGLTILILFLNQFTIFPLKGFSSFGPYTHREITFQAMEQFADDTKFEIAAPCAELIMQGNLQGDKLFPDRTEFHCDNSNFQGCSENLEKIVNEGKQLSGDPTLIRVGRGMHVIQDFYSHSNWAEMVAPLPILAPVEDMRNVSYIKNLQSGMYPYSHESINDQMDCFTAPESDWKIGLVGATHACMHKDGNNSIRGGTDVPGIGRTYHEFAGELAVAHTKKYLMSWYKSGHPGFLSCLVVKVGNGGCNHKIIRKMK
ncbi:hypothetical protein LPTSP3_g02360 [Leptospira kobayashii]|uniref:VWA7 N-terminal domain-containing protein n=1 Tax=Leptospira kobayashii TaxID=1917830 RepID=A0ABM7UFH0_9LEPT|nr:hypothetical protein [Leptospira kobayashii]BDA77306.1 hypothetical protein LPTSP3_g02360 [Leptospira kobayashii]